ncbi:MAG: M48 family metallopeptidase [Candidatus Micrarchaeota archaeon]|nr:M48 family metallopeptidase [Candidatus Micrarchaeota archaeon]
MDEGHLDIYGQRIRYEFVEKPNLRNSYMRFVDDKLLVVSSSQRRMGTLIEKHKSWIFRHYNQIKSSIRMFDANSMLFAGKRYYVALRESRERSVQLNDNVILVSGPRGSHDAIVKGWIRAKTLFYAANRLERKTELLGREARQVKARRLRKWGMCSSKGDITFNAFLSMLPETLLDYVVSHEASHLIHMNHSKDFWETVASICPDYKALRKELSKYDNGERPVGGATA